MKRYIRSTDYTSVEYKRRQSAIIDIVDKTCQENNCLMEFHPGGYPGTVFGILAEYKGRLDVVNDKGEPCVGKYNCRFSKLPMDDSFPYANDERISQSVISYIDYFGETLHWLESIVEQLPTYSAILSGACRIATKLLRSKYDDVSIDYYLKPFYRSDDNVVWFYDMDHELNFFGIRVVVDSHPIDVEYPIEDIADSGQIASYIVSQVSGQSKKNKASISDASIVSLLKEHNIDTTKQKYELRAETYDRYESGRNYTKKFTCPGDWLAYFSMCLHKSPTAASLVDYFGDIEEFEHYVEDYPTVDDIKEQASSSWWGDGDDFIIYLKNLTTGELLYSGGEEAEYDEEGWQD